MSKDGSCMCGNLKYSFTGDPNATALCHCLDCRKISGSTHSLNYLVSDDNFKLVSGKPKEWAKTADSGNKIVSFFCADCGSTLWRETPTFEKTKIIKGGSLLSGHDDYVPALELYTDVRVPWQTAVQGADQKKTMS